MTKLISLAGLVPSNEGIEFQNGAFFKQLALVLEQHHPDTRRSMRKADFEKLGADMDAVIKKFTGLKSDVVWEEFDMNAYVSCPILNANSPIYLSLNEWYTEGTYGVDYFVKKKGSAFNLDPKTGRVSGLITEQEFMIGAPAITYRNNKLTNEELAAIILHEVGHVFSMLEMLDKTCSSNSILTELDHRLRSGLAPKEREVVLEKAGKALGFEGDVIEDATKTTDDKIALTIFVGNAIKRIRTSSGDNFLDVNTWETLADQFAARHGAAKAMVSALDKMFNGATLTSRSNAAYLIMEVVKMLRTLTLTLGGGGLVALGAATLASGGIATLFYGLFFLAVGVASIFEGSQEGDGTYATAYVRLTRLKQQLVEQVKRLQHGVAPIEMQHQLLADISAVDEILTSYADRKGWLDAVASFLSTTFKNKQANIKFQKALESLSMNDLFVKSLELKTA
jgi:hypothetical protein